MAKKFGLDLLRIQLLEKVDGEFAYLRTEHPGESPLEALFYAAVASIVRFGETEYRVLLTPGTNEAAFERMIESTSVATMGDHLILRSQVRFEKRRVDFVISALNHKDGVWRHLIVECDGHNFHERTKEQAARDRSRDRIAIIDGIDVFRFTGSELWRNPWGCAEQVIEWAMRGWE